jgi:hypothetical protein
VKTWRSGKLLSQSRYYYSFSLICKHYVDICFTLCLLCSGCKAEHSEGAAVISGENGENAGASLKIAFLIRFVDHQLEPPLIPIPFNQESLTASSLQHQNAVNNAVSDQDIAIFNFLLRSTQHSLGRLESFMTAQEAVCAADDFDAEERKCLLDESDRQLIEGRDKGRAELEKTKNDLHELRAKERHDESLKLVDELREKPLQIDLKKVYLSATYFPTLCAAFMHDR